MWRRYDFHYLSFERTCLVIEPSYTNPADALCPSARNVRCKPLVKVTLFSPKRQKHVFFIVELLIALFLFCPSVSGSPCNVVSLLTHCSALVVRPPPQFLRPVQLSAVRF